MKHPEILLLPLLVLSDYWLTILGAIQKEKGYGDHFKVQHYELNPLWQKANGRKQWLNPALNPPVGTHGEGTYKETRRGRKPRAQCIVP